MSTNISSGNLNLESQLLSIMDVLVKAAVAEISQLFSESSSSLRLHLSQSLKENEGLRMRMKVMRSELFSLRLQTRTNRPASRFSPLKTNVSKGRTKSQAVVIKPPEGQKAVGEAATIPLQVENKNPNPAAEKCTDVESIDVILIKDEDDIGDCGPGVGQGDFGNHNTQIPAATETPNLAATGFSCLTGDNGELRIVSVHGRGHGPLQEERDTLFSASELQVFSSLSSDQAISHGSLPGFTTGTNDRASMPGMQDNGVGLGRSSQLELTQSAQTTSLNPTAILETGSEGKGAHPGHISQFPQQQNPVFPHGANKSLDCGFCGEWFPSREELIVHRATHTGEPPFSAPCAANRLSTGPRSTSTCAFTPERSRTRASSAGSASHRTAA
ncbi:uncharacterized protein LOC117520745 isoform X3 [Thalassophryne amazonica]|uniref:uncharacterized protein LOC117520745 isoform X3 n=1 Tax=Thalassophryne amazonica TaxID=390379 RepID=UPI001470D13F|nr:uncharacterized protein LOC117520745 isoform X3 [Thalassophryne amazonica]